MILINQFDARYCDGTPLSVCRTVQVAVNEKKILFVYKEQSVHKEDNRMMYSVIFFDDGTNIMCKDDIGEFDSFVRFKYACTDVLINKDNVKIVQDEGWRTIVVFNEKDWVDTLDKFDEVVMRLG